MQRCRPREAREGNGRNCCGLGEPDYRTGCPFSSATSADVSLHRLLVNPIHGRFTCHTLAAGTVWWLSEGRAVKENQAGKNQVEERPEKLVKAVMREQHHRCLRLVSLA